MAKSDQSVRGDQGKKKKNFISLKKDESNFDEWFAQDLGEEMKKMRSVTQKEIDSLLSSK